MMEMASASVLLVLSDPELCWAVESMDGLVEKALVEGGRERKEVWTSKKEIIACGYSHPENHEPRDPRSDVLLGPSIERAFATLC